MSTDEIKVTAEMIEAGVREFKDHINTDKYDPIYTAEEIVGFIYRVMARTRYAVGDVDEERKA